MRSIPEILSGGGFVSGEEISRELGLTRAAVWKRIGALRAEGWDIESGGKRGYRLRAGDSLAPELWQPQLTTRWCGRGEVRFDREVASTNLVCRELALRGAPAGSLSLCETQTAGRGRLGRSWISPPESGLWQSVLLRPALPPQSAPLITLTVALAMAEALRETTGIPVRIKWPNDLVCGGKKICGILLESAADPDRLEFVIAGVGLNVRPGAVPEALRGQAACVADFCAAPPRRVLLCAYLAKLERDIDTLEREGFAALGSAYRGLSCTLGSAVRVSAAGGESFTGTAEDIDAEGALIVRCADGNLRRLWAGDVSVRGVMGYV